MSYTFFAVGCYIAMRAAQVLCQGREKERWATVLIRAVAVVTLYAALASLIIWYKEIPLLGFDPRQ